MILTLFTIFVEYFLMLGLILCIAYCSGFIALAPTDVNKGNEIRFLRWDEKVILTYLRHHRITLGDPNCSFIDWILYWYYQSIR